MKVMKSLLLGSAAGMFAVAGAQAADLPVKAQPVEYVQICPAYGAGFYYIPGTDICLRVGGFVRADIGHNSHTAFPFGFPFNVGGGEVDREFKRLDFHTRAGIILDARQQTAYGTLRAYLDMGTEMITAHSNPGAPVRQSWGASRAFIQFAGFTFGRATSFYDFYGSTGPFANLVNLGGTSSTGATGWNVLAYTAQFGGGMSGSISIEDTRARAIVTSTATTFMDTTPRAGQVVPAFVGNLRWDGAAGSAQIMGAVQEIRPQATFGDTKWGWAAGGGFTWRNQAAPGSVFGVQASYCDGAIQYCGNSYAGHNINGNIGIAADAVMTTAGSVSTVKAWGVNAGYQHRFNPNYAFTIHGNYTKYDVPSAWTAASDFSFWQLGVRSLWTPTPGLDFAIDVMYNDFQNSTGTGGRDSFWSGLFRVIRNF